MKTLLLSALLALSLAANGKEKKIAVFVGLCDNESQGIAKVGARIGDGDKPDANLYWGCDDGLKSYFKRSSKWKLEKQNLETGDPRILQRLSFKHTSLDAQLVAEAWRGSNLRNALMAFEQACVSGTFDLVIFIGHNPLMDSRVPPPVKPATKKTDAIVLCCLSQDYFGERLEKLDVNPVLTTASLMYPGSFIAHDACESWLRGGSPADLRQAAAKTYARNQKISTRAALSVFAKTEQP